MTAREIFSIAAALQGALVILLLLSRNQNRQGNRLLALFVFIVFFQILVKSFESEQLYTDYPPLYLLPFDLYFLLGPIVFLYVRSVVLKSPALKWIHLWLLVPFCVAVAHDLPYMLMEPAEKFSHWTQNGIYTSLLWDTSSAIAVQLTGTLFSWFAFILIRRHETQTYNSYSNDENKRTQWIKRLVLGLTLFYAISLVVEVSAFTFPGQWLTWLYWYNPLFFGFILLVYSISFQAIIQPQLFGELHSSNIILEKSETHRSYGRSGLEREDMMKHLKSLQEYMTVEKPYLNPTLNIEQLSNVLNLSKHNISQVLNLGLGKNFYQYVNDFRVQKTLNLLIRYPQKTLLEIAYSSGFNSKASFNRIFREKTGMSPSQYRKQLKLADLTGTADELRNWNIEFGVGG